MRLERTMKGRAHAFVGKIGNGELQSWKVDQQKAGGEKRSRKERTGWIKSKGGALKLCIKNDQITANL